MDNALNWMQKTFKPLTDQVNEGIKDVRSGQMGEKMNRGFTDFKQLAAEKLGTTQDITELPADYVALEQRVDALRTVHTNLLKLLRSQHSTLLPQSMQDTMNDLTRSLTVGTSPSSSSQYSQGALPEHLGRPKTFSHAIAAATLQSSAQFGSQEPLGTALKKYGESQEAIGFAKLAFDDKVEKQFNEPFAATLAGRINNATKARKEVQVARLHLDACRAKFRNPATAQQDTIRAEFEQAEDAFVAAIENAQTQMKLCVENPEPLKNFHDLVKAEMNYFQESLKAMEGLAEEVDEMYVTQDAVYRSSDQAA